LRQRAGCFLSAPECVCICFNYIKLAHVAMLHVSYTVKYIFLNVFKNSKSLCKDILKEYKKFEALFRTL